jgi:ribosomal protein S18 acetylase RimI-like enzyme
MVQLVPMTEEEFRIFLEHDIHEYAKAQVLAGEWSQAESLARSRREHRVLLKDGLKSKFHHLYTIRESESDQEVGVLWFRANLDSAKASGFIFDLEIDEPFRRKGYARQAMLELEKIAREMGLRQLALHVFAYNEQARALYESLGYTASSLNLHKGI